MGCWRANRHATAVVEFLKTDVPAIAVRRRKEFDEISATMLEADGRNRIIHYLMVYTLYIWFGTLRLRGCLTAF